MDMAELLRRERDKRNHKQTAVAEVVGMDQRTLSKWESGDIPEALIWFRNLANYYGVSADYLLGTEVPHLSPEERAAIELLSQISPAKRGAALAVLKAAVELTQVEEFETSPAPANDGGGVTFNRQEHEDQQKILNGQTKNELLALLKKMLPQADYEYVEKSVEAGEPLTEADINRLLQAPGHKPIQKGLETLNNNGLTGQG